MKVKSESEVTQSHPTLCDPMDGVAYEATPSMGFSRQEYWSGWPLLSPFENYQPTNLTDRLGFLGGSAVKNPSSNSGDTGDVGSIPGSRRSPGIGNGNPLLYSFLENSMDKGA